MTLPLTTVTTAPTMIVGHVRLKNAYQGVRGTGWAFGRQVGAQPSTRVGNSKGMCIEG